MLSPRAIALQGIGFGALLVAVQGFAPVTQTNVVVAEPPKYYSVAQENLRRQQLEEDEVILAVIQQFVMEA